MNLLLFEAGELQGRVLLLRDRRHRHLREVLGVRPGDTVRVGQVNGGVGTGLVEGVEKDCTRLAVELHSAAPQRPGITLILALPRPIMFQRILKQATVLGVRHFHVLRSSRVEKSFFHSPVLQPEKIGMLLREGLEQAMDTWMPTVAIHHRFKPFVEDVLPGLSGAGLIAHPGAEKPLHRVCPAAAGKPLRLAVGPEGGWSEYEYERFLDAGFAGFTMGKRILHVDTAVAALLAQIDQLVVMEREGVADTDEVPQNKMKTKA